MKAIQIFLIATLLICTSLSNAATVAIIHESDTPLTDQCDGTGTPLPDGTSVRIFWDYNGNGPDAADSLLPLGSGPGLWNYNSFVLNGTALGLGAGRFCTDVGLSTMLIPTPARLYLKICVNGMPYVSNTINLIEGYNEAEVDWRCIPDGSCPNCVSLTTPVSLAASDTSCYGVYLNWSDTDLESGFIIQRNGQTLGTTGWNVLSYVDTTATIGQFFEYTVTPFNGCGNGPVSNSAQGKRWCPVLQVVSPNGGGTWTAGQIYLITWTTQDVTGNVKLELNRSYPSAAWEVLAASATNSGSYSWTVTGPATTTARVRTTSVSAPAVGDTSDASFAISELCVSGNVRDTWHLAQSPIQVCGDLIVPSGDSLIIEAGVRVEFTGHYKFTVNGLLKAIGTAQDSIRFTCDTLVNTEWWQGIRFYGTADTSRLSYCVVEHGRATVNQSPEYYGAGLYISSGARLVMSHTMIRENRNDVGPGGGVMFDHSVPMISDCVFRQNHAASSGGGLYLWMTSSAMVANCVFDRNNALQEGGGVLVEGSSQISGCTMRGNSSGQSGGGMSVIAGTSTVTNCAIVGNTSGDGGGVHFRSGASASITNCRIDSNTSGQRGGGLYAVSSSFPILASSFSHNTADNGGAIYCQSGTISASSCTLTDNLATSTDHNGDGGAVYSYNCSPAFTNCVFSSNHANDAQGDGGALLATFGQPTLSYCTLWGNSAGNSGGGGGVCCQTNGSPILRSTILSSNTNGAVVCEPGSLTPSLNNCDLFGNGGGDWIGCIAGQQGTNGNLSVDPDFANAAGGDFRLNSTSHCIGAGDLASAPSTDIEGNPRPNPAGSSPDLGAYESARLTPLLPTLTLSAPDGGETWHVNEIRPVTWVSENMSGNVNIELNRYYPSSSWEVIAANAPNTGNYSWTVNGPIATTARVRVISVAQPSVGDTSNADFQISGIPAQPVNLSLSATAYGQYCNNYYPSKAIDGNTATFWNTCTYSGELTIALAHPSHVDSLVLLNQMLPNGTAHHIISVSADSANWTTIIDTTGDFFQYEWWTVPMLPTVGSVRFIRITTPHTVTWLAWPEVQVWGIEARSLTVTVPDGGEQWSTGDIHAITWTSENVTDNIRLELNRSYPSSSWEVIAASVSNSGSYAWTVTGSATTMARVRITSVSQPFVGDTSDANFVIVEPCFSGNVHGTWRQSQSPIQVCGDVTVPSGDSLIIEPGVRVEFLGHYKLTVNGLLKAIGTAQDSILFTCDTITNSNRWWGIRFDSANPACRLEYCVIENGEANGTYIDGDGGGICCLNSSTTISRCTIRNNRAYDGGGVFLNLASASVISRCDFYGNQSDFGAGVEFYNCTVTPTLVNCLIHNNTARFGGAGLYSHVTPSAFIQSCTFTGNSCETGGGGVDLSSSFPHFVNTIIALSGGPEINFRTGAGGAFEYCGIYHVGSATIQGSGPAGLGILSQTNTNGDSSDQYHNIFLDPRFANAGGSNYHLTDSSHCIGAGDTTGVPVTDIEGNLRPNPAGSLPDIGAYENVRGTPLGLIGGLAGHWPFDGNAQDVSGNGWTGILHGGTTPTSDRFGNPAGALHFDGIDAWVGTGYPGILGNQPRSISFWMRSTSVSSAAVVFYGATAEAGGCGNSFNCMANAGTGWEGTGVGTDIRCGEVSYPVNEVDGLWHHCVWVVPSESALTLGNVHTYYDGQPLFNDPIWHGHADTTSLHTEAGLAVRFAWGIGSWYDGDLDEVRIYDRALSDSEVYALYGGGNPTLSLSVPNGGEQWVTGGTQAITWTSQNVTDNIKLELNRSYPSGAWEVIAASVTNSGSYSWTVTGPATTNARVRVSATVLDGVIDTSNADFSIANAPPIAWSSQISGTKSALIGVSFVDVNNGWAVGSGGVIRHTTDGGSSWTGQSRGPGNNLYGVSFADVHHGWVSAVGDGILTTTNGGASWTMVNFGSNALYGVASTDTNNVWAVGDGADILHSTNGGTSWTLQFNEPGSTLRSVAFADVNNGWAVGVSGTTLHTTNGGSTWTGQSSGTAATLFGVAFVDVNNGWAVGSGGTIQHTINGSTWTGQVSGTTSTLYSVAFADVNNGWSFGSGGLILYTTNGGFTWAPQGSGTASDLYGADFVGAGYGWTVGDGGTVLHYTSVLPPTLTVTLPNGGESWRVDDVNTITWTSAGLSGNVMIELNRRYPTGSWETLAQTPNDGTETLSLPGPASFASRIRIRSVENPLIGDTSNANFSLLCGPTSLPYVEQFAASQLEQCWTWINEDPAYWNLTEHSGWLRIYTHGALDGAGGVNTLLRQRPASSCVVETHLQFSPSEHYHGAGLLLYLNEQHRILFHRSFNDSGQNLAVQGINNECGQERFLGNTSTDLYLRMDLDGTYARLFWSPDNSVWTSVGDLQCDWFTDPQTKIGVFAEHGFTSAPDIPADFEYFRVDSLSPALSCSFPYTEVDLGDLPACYPTLANNPAHGLSGVAWLGATITGETTPRSSDNGDDGAAFLSTPWTVGDTAQVQVTLTTGPNYARFLQCSGHLYLNGWMDGNVDGDFCDTLVGGQAPEWIVRDQPAAVGIQTVRFRVPGLFGQGVMDGILRWRLTSHAVGARGFGLADPGQCPSMVCGTFALDSVGEVEDYVLNDAVISPSQSLTTIAPDGGESWFAGEVHAITWTSQNLYDNVEIEVNRSYPSAAWDLVAASIANSGFYNWTVTGPATSAARVRVTSTAQPTVGDSSNASFVINSPSITVTIPNGGEAWSTGETHSITWLSQGLTGNVSVSLNRSYPGATWETLSASTPGDGSYSWVVTSPATSTARIRVISAEQPAIGDTSNANFSISGPVPVTFTSNTTIGRGTATYEGYDVTVSGCVLTVAGRHGFNSLSIINSGTVTHAAEDTGGVNLTVVQDVFIEGSSSITANARGYGVASGPGAGSELGGSGSGGGYGGSGGMSSVGAVGGAVYGEIATPLDMGSGGGYFPGGAGGGIIRLEVQGELTVSGTLSANGNDATSGTYGGGGSGGSVYLTVTTLAGGGIISASGGAAYDASVGGGGGGGRIAVYYGSNQFGGTLSACGGIGRQYGGAGTIYKKPSGQSPADLIVSNCNHSGAVTLLSGIVQLNTLEVSSSAIVRPNGSLELQGDMLAAAGGVIEAGDSFTVTGDASIASAGLIRSMVGERLEIMVAGNVTVDVGGSISADGRGYGVANGPGSGSELGGSGGGGGYGGVGGASSVGAVGGAVYGAIATPLDLGSGGGYFTGGEGGGAIRLIVHGALTVSGALSANGNGPTSGTYGGGGSGGSIYVTATTLAGNGNISASGGAAYYSSVGGGGGGGRIAIYRTTSTFPSDHITVAGGNGYQNGFPGTIFQAHAAPAIFLTTPNIASTWFIGETDSIKWSSHDLPGNIRIELNRDYPAGAWTVLASDAPNTGGYPWTVSGSVTTHARVRVSNVDLPEISDSSDTDFSIAQPVITMTSPNGGELWLVGETRSVTWSRNFGGNVIIGLNRSYPASIWETLAASTPNNGSYSWTVNAPVTSFARIRVLSLSLPLVGDTSDANFAIPLPGLTITGPNGGETWYVTNSDTIRWTSQNLGGRVRVELNRSYPSSAWETLSADTINGGMFIWTVNGTTSSTARVRVRSTIDPSIGDTSDNNCAILMPSVTLASPNGAEVWYVTNPDTIVWNSQHLAGNVKIEVNRTYPAGGWETLASSIGNSGRLPWSVSGAATNAARMRVTSMLSNLVSDTSDTNFSIVTPSLTVLQPNGGQTWNVGDTNSVTWTAPQLSGYVSIDLNRAYPAGSWETVAPDVANNGLFRWRVLRPITTAARFRVRSLTLPILGDTTDGDFTIPQPPPESMPGIAANPSPFIGATNVLPTPRLSWSPAARAESYDLFVWQDSTSEPLSPTVANLSITYWQVTSALTSGRSYRWAVTAKNIFGETAGPDWTFAVRSLPDLKVDTVMVGPAWSGQPVQVTWRISNHGLGASNTPEWYDRVWISPDSVIDIDEPEDHLLGTFSNAAALAPGESYMVTQSVNIPADRNGMCYIFVLTDNLDALFINWATWCAWSHGFGPVVESNECNNFNYARINVAASPTADLQVTSLLAAPGEVFSGDTVRVQWNVANLGAVPTVVTSWTDGVYLSPDSILSGGDQLLLSQTHNGVLAADSAYGAVRTIHMPNAIYGTFYLIAKTDIADNVFEANAESNNAERHQTILITLAPPPDLVVDSIAIPLTAADREVVTIAWRVCNQGPGAPFETGWSDRVYLSSDSVFNGQSDMILGNFPRSGGLAPGGTYFLQGSVSIPNGATGPQFIFVMTDCNNQVFEHGADTNNVSHSTMSILLTNPDLAVGAISIPQGANSGQTATLQWTVRNQTGGALLNGSWSDRVYLSQNPVFNASTATVLGSYGRTGNLQENETYTQQSVVTLPNGIAGLYYVFVKTDYADQIFENGSEANNLRRSDTTFAITLSPWADLQVTAVQVPAEITAGSLLSVVFTVADSGTASVPAGSWTDKVFLSTNSVWTPSSNIEVASGMRSGPLASQATYNTLRTWTLSTALSGTYYVYVQTDVNNSVYEYSDEGNNILRSTALVIHPYPNVNLAVTGLAAGDSAWSGQSLAVQWTVRNGGVARTLVSSWNDIVYLSNDTTFDPGSDVQLFFATHFGALDPNQSYQESRTITVPDGIQGQYYVIVRTDANGYSADTDPSNNVRASGIVSIRLTPYADLRMTSVTADTVGTAGQPVQCQWTVSNTGTGPTVVVPWYDAIYLSLDTLLDAGDVRLLTIGHSSSLSPGLHYVENQAADLPSYASGNYYLIFRTDQSNVIYEYNGEANNAVSRPVAITLLPPSDLIVTDIMVPDTAAPGDSVTVSWTLRNVGENPAVGVMRDGVYFSEDTLWDLTDALLGVSNRTVNIAPGSSMSLATKVGISRSLRADSAGVLDEERNGEIGSAHDELPGLAPGWYHAIVRTDLRDNIRESDNGNNTGVSAATMHVGLLNLTLGSPLSVTVAPGAMRYYRVDVGNGLDLRLELSGNVNGAMNELYASFGQIPTLLNSDFRSNAPFTSGQELLIPSTQAGSYYVMDMARSLPPGHATEQLTVTARTLEFSVLSLTPDQGGVNGSVTCTVHGAGFDSTLQVTLSSTDTVVHGLVLSVSSRMEALVNWDLNRVPERSYDVIVTRSDNSQDVLPSGFAVVPQSGTLELTIQGPSLMRTDRDYQYDFYASNGMNVDLTNVRILVQIPAGIEYRVSDTSAYQLTASDAVIEAMILQAFPGSTQSLSLSLRSQLPLGTSMITASMVEPDGRLGFESGYLGHLISSGGDTGQVITLPPRDSTGYDSSMLWNWASAGPGYFEYFRVFDASGSPLRDDWGVRLGGDSVAIFCGQMVGDNEGQLYPGTGRIQVFSMASLMSGPVEQWDGEIVRFDHRYSVRPASKAEMPAFGDRVKQNLALRGTRQLGLCRHPDFDPITGQCTVCDNLAISSLDNAMWLGYHGARSAELRGTISGVLEEWLHEDKIIASSAVNILAQYNLGVIDTGLAGTLRRRIRDGRTLRIRLVASQDPNDVLGPVGFGERGWVAAEDPCGYTIHFENEPSRATAPAQVVRISVQLNSTVNLNSFRLGSFGFANMTFSVPENQAYYTQRLDLRDSLGVYLDVIAGVDVNSSQAFWAFQSIDPVTGLSPVNPLLGFLQVNDTLQHRGEGFASYIIYPNETTQSGDSVSAQASIVFDRNEPITTRIVYNAVDAGRPVSRTDSTLTAINDTTVVLRWSGRDDEGGCGIADYSIFESVNDGPFELLQSGIADTFAAFAGNLYNRYAFFSIARDNANHSEAMKSHAENAVYFAMPAPAKNVTDLRIRVTQNGGTGSAFLTWSVVRSDTAGGNITVDAYRIYSVTALTGVGSLWELVGTTVDTTFTYPISVNDNTLHRFFQVIAHRSAGAGPMRYRGNEPAFGSARQNLISGQGIIRANPGKAERRPIVRE